jgi:hypothetical protein
MIEASKREPESHPEDEPRNPSSDELDVEGPNESAPGHEPTGDEGEQDPARSTRPAE